MNSTTLIVIAVIVVIALIAFLLVRGRKQHVTFADAAPLARKAAAEDAHVRVTPAPATAAPEDHGVATEIADAVEDVVDQFMGINSHPSGEAAKPAGDPLTQLKGLGPKAATLLNGLGVTRFEQIAAWNDADVTAIDTQMGAFKGRIVRDRWVDQARLLASGDTAAFEAEFGKLGG